MYYALTKHSTKLLANSTLHWPYIVDDSAYPLMIHNMKVFFDRGNGDMYKDVF